VTDDGEQERAAELARQVEAMREQGMPIFREVRQFIDDAQVAEASAAQSPPSLVRQIGEAMDSADEVIAAVRKLGGLGGTAANTSQASASLTAVAMITASGGLTLAKPRIVADGDVATATESASVVKLEDSGQGIDELSVKVSQEGIAGLSTTQLLVLVLVWLLTIGAPVVQLALPPEAQTAVSNEYATLGIAITITLLIVQNRKH
jgi:hypothetical protein